MRRRSHYSALLASALVVGAALTGCGAYTSVSAPARSAVSSQLAAEPSSVIAPAPPNLVELRTPDGVTYLSAEMYPDPIVRGGSTGQELNPADERPAWWGESGMPGTETAETVVVAGHNYSSRVAPFRALEAVAPDDTVLLRTPNGVLSYGVQTVGPLPKGSLLGDDELRAQVPGRLILANCDVRNGEPTANNYVVVAQLTSGK